MKGYQRCPREDTIQRVQPFTTDSFLEFQFLGLACPQAVIHGGQEGVQDWPSHHALADTRALMAGYRA